MTKVKTNQQATSSSELQKNRVLRKKIKHQRRPNATLYAYRTLSQKTVSQEFTNDYSKASIIKPHKKTKQISLESTTQTKFTVQCIVDFLTQKYPDYKSYVDRALQYIDPETIILNIREAECHINHICKNMKLGFFQTSIVRSAVTSTLADRGMPK
jgi:hypothetical protein